MQKLTEKETEMLLRFPKDEYLGGDLSASTWSWSIVRDDGRSGAAVVGSLAKKGLVICSGWGKDATVELTAEGIATVEELVKLSEAPALLRLLPQDDGTLVYTKWVPAKIADPEDGDFEQITVQEGLRLLATKGTEVIVAANDLERDDTHWECERSLMERI